jgi:hypothetical protein
MWVAHHQDDLLRVNGITDTVSRAVAATVQDEKEETKAVT